MNIGIIGAGHIGGTLARRFAAAGHTVAIANSRGPASLAALADETGATAATVEEAVQGRDVVVVTIPMKNIPQLPAGLLAALAPPAVVIDTNNYYPRHRDGRIDAIEQGMPESRWVEQQLGHPVVKAFNNIFAQHLLERGQPAGAPGRIALPVAGDDEQAKQAVIGLLNDIGFDGVDAGGLDESWRQQPGTPVYAADGDVETTRKLLAQAQPGRKSEWRAG